MKKLLLIMGDLATGKSTFANTLAKRYNTSFFSKDTMELRLFMFAEFAKLEKSLILESNFHTAELERFHQKAAENGYDVLTLVLRGNVEVLHKRYLNRMTNENRHPVHLSTTMDVFENFKGYTEYSRTEKIPGKVIEINADDFSYQTDEVLLEKIDEFMKNESELYIELQDDEWPFVYTDHDREIARAIVLDDQGEFYFMRAVRDDDFGKAIIIETSGGGVEEGESLSEAIKRELKEELGAKVEILCKIGVISDYYNLIHRHNINHYYLCKIQALGDTHMTQDEVERFHLSTLKLNYEDAIKEYETCSNTKLGRLIANRELPILKRAKELLDEFMKR